MVGIQWDSVVWSLISLTGCSRFALSSSICVGSLVVLGFLPVAGSFVGGFSPPVVYYCSLLPPNLVSDQWQGVGKMN